MNDAAPRETASREIQLARSFSAGQLKLLKATVLSLAAAVLVAVVLLGLWGLGQLIAMFQAILLPIAVAGVLALVLHPVSEFLHHRVRLPRVVAVSVLVTLLIVALAAGTWLLAPIVAQQLTNLLQRIPVMLDHLHDLTVGRFPTLAEYIVNRFEQVDWNELLMPEGDAALERAGAIAALLVASAFIPLFLFFFLLIGQRLERVTTEVTAVLSSDAQREVRYLVDMFIEYLAAFFRGQLLIALIMGVLFAVGFTLVGLQTAILLGLFLGLLNIVPFLGTLIGLLTVLPLAYIQDGMPLMLLTLGVFTLVQLIESWYLTPRIMSDRSGLHPMIVVISLFFWGTILGGIIGVLLAVPLSAFVATLWHQMRFHYISKVVPPVPAEQLETQASEAQVEEPETRGRIIAP